MVYPAVAEQAEALKAFMKALKTKLETASPKEKKYNPHFVDKIKTGEKKVEQVQYAMVEKQDLQGFLGCAKLSLVFFKAHRNRYYVS